MVRGVLMCLAGSDPSGSTWQPWTDQLVYAVLAGLVWGGAKLAAAPEEHARVMEAAAAYMSARPIQVRTRTTADTHSLVHLLNNLAKEGYCVLRSRSCCGASCMRWLLGHAHMLMYVPAGECRAAANVWSCGCC